MADTRSDETSRAGPEAPQRHARLGVDEVWIGRTAGGDTSRAGGQLRVGVTGSAASERHARLSRSLGRWQIEDQIGGSNTAWPWVIRIGPPSTPSSA
jgi:hypothetical protein